MMHVRLSVVLTVLLASWRATAEADCLASYTVTGFADLKTACTGASCPSLRAAVDAVNTCAPGATSTVNLASGSYVLTLAGSHEDANLDGDLDLTASGAHLIFQGVPGPGETQISAVSERVFHVVGVANVEFRNLWIEYGVEFSAGSTGLGGGIYNANAAASVTLVNSWLYGNQALQGGGAYNLGTMSLSGVAVESNIAQASTVNAYGGGIFSAAGSTLTVDRSLFGTNAATNQGSSLTPGEGAGIYATSASLTVRSTTFESESVNGPGASIYSDNTTAVVTNCTFSNEHSNALLMANFIFVNGAATFVVADSIFYNPPAGGSDCATAGGGLLTSGGNNIDSGNSCVTATTNGDRPFTDPDLAPFGIINGARNGYMPNRTSPAIDAGSISSCAALDQNGHPRYGMCDIGAVEFPGTCGDGLVQTPPEQCDDGARNTSDCLYAPSDKGCSVCTPTCQIVAGTPHFCGDNIVDANSGEQCDLGSGNHNDCPYSLSFTPCTVCNITCASVPGVAHYCGDSKTDAGETCDDGNVSNGDGCSSACQKEAAGGSTSGQPSVDAPTTVGSATARHKGCNAGGDAAPLGLLLLGSLYRWRRARLARLDTRDLG